MDYVQLQEEAKQTSSKVYDESKKRRRRNSDSDHILKKRITSRFPRKGNEIYVTNKSNFKGQLDHCEKLLEEGEKEIIIHGLGAAVTHTINLALQLKHNHHGTLELAVNTSTVGVVDDLEPLNDSGTYETQTCQKSSVHIRVFHTTLDDMN